MRLLLDEHHDAEVARRLREIGHDVVAVTERADLRGRPDDGIFGVAIDEERAVVTENVRDYIVLVREAAGRGRRHWGVIVTVPERLPRRRDARQRLIDALGRLLVEHPAPDALSDVVVWLSPLAPE